jgi:dihydropteroate synthase
MGVVNVTPDSFSDGSRFLHAPDAIAHGVALAEAGAAILDVGGESTRPGAEPVTTDEELGRVLPVVAELVARTRRPVSIDTTKAEVARAALDAGAAMVNDVSGGTADPGMFAVVAEANAALVVMHMRGTPRTMQAMTDYDDVVREVGDALHDRVAAALAAGVDARSVLVDPGIGFAKNLEQNITLLRALPEIAGRAGMPLVVGTSRKSFLGRILGDADLDRDDATLATIVWCFLNGAAIVRVHDAASAYRATELLDIMERATQNGLAA